MRKVTLGTLKNKKRQKDYQLRTIAAFAVGLLLCCGLHAQQIITGVVLEENSQEPVPFANIFLLTAQNRGVVTNELGQFEMGVPLSKESDTLVVSVLGFEVEKVAVADVESPCKVRLNKSALLLDEVTVTFKENVHKILRKANRRIPRNFGTRKFLARGYYQEYSIVDTSYAEFIESFVNITDRRYVAAEDESIIYVEQMRRSDDALTMPEEVQRFFAFNRIYTIYERMNNVRQRRFFSLDQKPHSKSPHRVDHYREYAEAGDTLIEIGYSSQLPDSDIGYGGSSGQILLRKGDLAILKMTRGNENDQTYHEVTYRKIGEKYFPNRISYKYAVEDDRGKKCAVSKVLYIYEVLSENHKGEGVRLERTQDVRDLEYSYDAEYWQENKILLKVPAPKAMRADLQKFGRLDRQFKKNGKRGKR